MKGVIEEAHAVPLRCGALSLRRTRPRGASRSAVVLLHGFGMNGEMWRLPGRSLSGWLASRGHDVFNLELRGVGRSRALGSRPASGLREHVEEDLPAALEAAATLSGHARVFLIGHSLGGLVGYCGLGLCEARLAGLITLSGVWTFAGHSRFLRAVSALGPVIGEGEGATSLAIPTLARLLWWGRLISDTGVGRALMPIHAWSPGTIEREVLREHLRVGWDVSSLGVLRQLLSLGRGEVYRCGEGRPYHGGMGVRSVPLLVVSAEHDTLLAPIDARAAYEASSSEARQFEVLGASSGHAPYGHLDLVIGREAPREVWPLLEFFCCRAAV